MQEMHRALDPDLAAAETLVLGQPLRTEVVAANSHSGMEHGPTSMHWQQMVMPPGLSRFALDPGLAAAETSGLGQAFRTEVVAASSHSGMEQGPTGMHGQQMAMPPGLSRFAEQNPMEQPEGTGVFGYYQGLLQSFGCGSNDMTHSVTNVCGGVQKQCHEVEEQGHDNTAQREKNEEIPGECILRYDASIDDIGSPSRLGVDESGYYSSASSVYDIYSDDEYYGNDNGTHGVLGEEYNVDDLAAANACDNTVEEGINASNQEEMVSPTATATCTGADAVEDCPCLNGNPFMHVMTAVGDGTHTWKKRNRTPQGVKRPASRVPKGIGPVEIAFRNAPNRKTKYIFEPLLGITFDSEEEAYEFYNMYSWEVGFGIKYDSLSANNSENNPTGRDLRCLCAGYPKRCEYNSKKTGCKAMLRLLRSEDDGWYISAHIAEHNHPLTVSCGEKREWFSHKRLDPRAKDMIRYLRENNVSLTKVHCIMGSMYGSMENVPFTKRSLQSMCHRIAKDQMDDDVQKTLCAFRELRKKDPGFQFSVLPDEHNRIKALLWINGKSRDQYKFFGDVLTFDTTYCTNIYKMPFGLFVGVNNHFQTTVFGGVFMKDETQLSFEWVFEEFASLMGENPPKTIFTDQCAAMASALSKVWKETRHLLCKWHVFKDAPAKLGPIYRRGSEFRKLFHKIINDMLTIDEFERAWDYMLKRFKLKDNEYLKALYDKKEKWAKAYFSDCFCAKMSSTQRSESANHMLKRFVPRNCSMNRFIVQFNKLLLDRNNAEDRAEFDTKIVNCVRKRAWPIEEHAAKVYTSAVHSLFRKEVDKSTNYFAIEKVEKKEFDVVHVKPQFKLPWGREKLTVVVNNGGESYDCECGLYNHFGVLCSHVLRVMVQIGAYEIPKAHIMKRWTRSAREILPGQYKTYEKDSLCMESMTYRNRYLYLDAIAVVADGNKDLGAFDIVATSLKEIKRKLEHYFRSKGNEENGGAGARTLVGARESKYYTTESDVGVDSASETEPTLYNSYGAAGSSAAMSDSELLSMKAPLANRPPGRPRQNRLKGALDYFGKKHKKNAGDNAECSQNKKRRIRCSECKLIGHSASVCKKKIVDLTAGIPDF